WRELRRLKCVEGLSQLAKEIVEAADSGNWKVFTKKMGGVFSLRKEQVFKPYYELLVDRGTGVVKTSQYCDSELMRALKGVFTVGREIITRVFQRQIDASIRHAF
ncbi:replication endonuclease, partial [Vibrio anguillarum]|nr:replication endonuclease [Vibrio anguillarum]